MHNGMTLTRIQGQGQGQRPESCKINQITPSGIASQNALQNWAFAAQSEISGTNLCESIFLVFYLIKTNVK